MTNSSIIPVILCGGSGTRLWPLSRESYPKQFLSISDDNGLSLLQKTVKRILPLKNLKTPIFICNEKHRFIVAEQLRKIKIKDFIILLEPFGRNTAPAITISALKAIEIEEDPTLLVLSSDHEVKENKKFLKVLEKGLSYTEKNKLVTFGVIPKSPEIGYGYIKAAKPFDGDKIEGFDITNFFEKPDLNTAKEFIKDKRFTWNSGIFMFKAKQILKEIKNNSPDIYFCCNEALNKSKEDLDFIRLDKKSLQNCKNIPIDIAVMEKTSNGKVIPLDVGWSDIGSWQSVWENAYKDSSGNYIEGKVFIENSNNSYLRSENRLIVGIGLKDMIVVETRDAILITEKNSSQKVKEVVNKLKINNIREGHTHTKVYRPWGHYLSVVENNRWQVKLIHVNPGEKLSLQMHHHRSEHWIVVNGTAKVEVDNVVKILSENQSIYIPLGSTHRLSNPGKIDLTLIEVQSGSYVGEDDIVRFDDKYGRSNKI